MSADAQITEAIENTDTPVENTPTNEQSNEKPAGYDPVDVSSASPDKIQERFDYLYSQVKSNERTMREYKSIAAEQSKYIEDLTNGMGQVVNHLETQNFSQEEDQVTKEMRAAFEAGDMDKFIANQKKLVQLEAKKSSPKQVQKPAQKQDPSYESMSQDDQKLVDAWQEETDERGQALRPWSKNTGTDDDPDPDFVRAMLIAQRVFKANPHKSARENLLEVDRKMGVKSTNMGGSQSVMGGQLQTLAKKQNIRLTPEQERLAVKMKFANEKGKPPKSDSEHIDAYRKQLQKVRSKGGK